ncbi:MauE/DoxX family redox-associated membrane protein [Nonomuraea candida]|uniref:MauE/DoxX family redox-associated membrane protein n=1 Tax=Nonomuraea candida TaxID=359159 RepID=UPI0006934070|nr:MauE/DoxX family redox-associated membrane protein [Nonomuraea candida]
MTYLSLGSRCFVAVVFALAVLGKARNRRELEEFVRATRSLIAAAAPRLRLGRRGLWAAALGVLAVEAAVCVLVLLPSWWPLGLALSAVLLAVFGAATTLALHRGVRALCHCFGGSAVPLSRWHVVRDAVILTVAVAGIVVPDRPGGEAAGFAVTVAVAAVAAMVTSRLDDILELFTSGADSLS